MANDNKLLIAEARMFAEARGERRNTAIVSRLADEAWDVDLCDDCHVAREQDYAERYDEARGSLWGELALDAARDIVYGGYDKGHYKAVHAGGWR